MEKILISRCLLGENCTYRGDGNFCEKAVKLSEKYELVPVCPEEDGGLPTPREPSERLGDKVLSKSGKDVTAEFEKGARAALKTALENGVKLAVMKARSPSCGSCVIYDGTFTGTKTARDGVAAELLKKHGIMVITEEEI